MHGECTLEDFKRAAAEFAKEAPTLGRRDLESGWSAVSGLYLRIPADPLTLALAPGYLRHASKAYLDRDVVLEFGYDPFEKLLKGLA